MSRRLTTKDFIEKAQAIHGDKYDYSLTEYRLSRLKLKVVCKIHGVFLIAANGHLAGAGCSECGGSKPLTTDEYIRRALAVHGNRYDYSKTIYVNNPTKILVRCLEHGEFMTWPDVHLKGHNCPRCSKVAKLTTEEFIARARAVYGKQYDYSKAVYNTAKTKVIITCKIHGDFSVLPHNHLKRTSGCPKCSSSKGERKIREFLTSMGIQHKEQKRFDTCRYKHTLPFDFVVFYRGEMYLIEYHGKQHYYPAKTMGRMCFSLSEARENLKQLKRRDKIKRQWAKDRFIPLLTIPYWIEDKISDRITKFLKYTPDTVDYVQLSF